MGDDLGDEWEADGLNSDDEGTSAAIEVAPNAIKKPAAVATAASAEGGKRKHGDAGGTSSVAGSRKRARAQLSAEGFEDRDDEDGGDGEGAGGERDGEGNRKEQGEEAVLRADEEEEEEEAKRRRAEKKKQKLKALKAKMKEKKKQRAAEEEAAEGRGTTPAVGAHSKGGDSEGAADHEGAELWGKFCRVRGDLVTPLELDSPWITAETLARVDGFGAHTDVKLAGFIKASLPDWKKRIQNRNSNAPRGSPSVLIVCAGARRCVEVMKHLTAFRCQVVKLFAKHLKLEEQKVMLKKGCFPLAVGTPGRMRALAACGSLRLDSAALLVLDTGKNVKGRNVLDMDGVANDTMELLAEHARPYLKSSSSSSPSTASRTPSSSPGKGRGGAGGSGRAAATAVAGQLRIALY